MAVNSIKQADQMDLSKARVAGIVCLALGLLSAALYAAGLVFADKLPKELPGPGPMGLGLVLSVILSVPSLYLIRGRIWAHQLLTALNLLGLVLGAILLLLSVMLLGSGLLAAAKGWLLGVTVASLALGVLVQWLLIRCSALRLRYGAIAGTSVAAAVALVIILNVFAQTDYFRKDIETQGRYALSERTKKILESTTQPVRLTCLYTSTDERNRGSDFSPRVLELLGEMHEKNSRIEIVNASSDAEKALVVLRLKTAATEQAKKHLEFFNDFKKRAPKLIEAIQSEKRQWADLPGNSYLNLWGLGAEMVRLLDGLSQDLEKTQGTLSRELAGSTLPDYAKLAASLTEMLTNSGKSMTGSADILNTFVKIPPTIAQNRQNVLDQADKAAQAMKAMDDALDSMSAPGTAGNTEKVTKAAAAAAGQLAAVVKVLDNVAGDDKETIALVQNSRPMIFRNMTLGDFYEQMAGVAQKAFVFAQSIGKTVKTELQPEVFANIRSQISKLLPQLQEARGALAEGLDRLAKVDEPTAALLKPSAGGKFLQAIRNEIDQMSTQAQKLPALKADTLSADLAQENSILIETGDKVQVVSFDEVWPLKVQRQGIEDPSSQDKRVFNGDAAVSSKILAMTHKPFATVLLTSLELPPQLASRLPRSYSSQDYSTLRKRLTDANFAVKDWNLAEEMPAPDESTKVRILLVLPPAPIPTMAAGQVPSFGPDHMDKIRKAIDTQAVDGAIFLANFPPASMMLMPTFNIIADYLASQWGIEVKNDFFVMYAQADETAPGRFSVNFQRISYMPLTGLGDHPISKPLRSQRLLGANTCPILIADKRPDNVRVEPLLSVPATREIWATRKFQELARQFRSAEGSLIQPDYAAGDMAAPFPLAVAATRTQDKAKNIKDARIVVTSMADVLADGYLDQPIMEQTSKGSIVLNDPPRANADLVANSVYWLSGNNDYIAAGPAAVQPLQMIDAPVLSAFKMIFLIGLPLALLACGAAVLAIRKRQ